MTARRGQSPPIVQVTSIDDLARVGEALKQNEAALLSDIRDRCSTVIDSSVALRELVEQRLADLAPQQEDGGRQEDAEPEMGKGGDPIPEPAEGTDKALFAAIVTALRTEGMPTRVTDLRRLVQASGNGATRKGEHWKALQTRVARVLNGNPDAFVDTGRAGWSLR